MLRKGFCNIFYGTLIFLSPFFVDSVEIWPFALPYL